MPPVPEILDEKLFIQEECEGNIDSKREISSIVVKAVKTN
jgi:hypothetical protein